MVLFLAGGSKDHCSRSNEPPSGALVGRRLDGAGVGKVLPQSFFAGPNGKAISFRDPSKGVRR